MAMAAAGLTAITSLISGVQGFTAGQYQAMVAKNNAKLAMQNAVKAVEEGQQDKIDNDFDIRDMLGEQTAAQSASGLSLSSRSSVGVRNSTRLTGEIEGRRIMADAMQNAKNFKQQAADFKAESKASKVSSYFDLAGGVVGAAAAIAGGVNDYKNSQKTSLVSKATPTEMNKRFVPRPRLKPSRLRYLGSATYGGPR